MRPTSSGTAIFSKPVAYSPSRFIVWLYSVSFAKYVRNVNTLFICFVNPAIKLVVNYVFLRQS
jgi:hypothetical protein